MHINEKILSAINFTLNNKYSIYISDEEWDFFKSPITNTLGEIDKVRFLNRQEKSAKIIKEILDYHGKGEVVKFLAELASIEPRIQSLQPWVRDHVVHAINTFLLGVFLLKNLNFPQIVNTRYSYPFLWKLCGPTHDLGYPIEIANNIKKPFIKKLNEILDGVESPSPRIREISYPENLNKLCNQVDSNELIQNRLSEWGLDININDYYSWLRNQNKVDHGVISALSLLKVIDALYQHRNPRRVNEDIVINNLNYNQKNFSYDIVSASSAVFIHNIDITYSGFSRKIEFSYAPLAFLLFLCDTFQEWDRYTENGEVYSGNNFDIQCSNNSIKLYVPSKLVNDIKNILNNRLDGLKISVNDHIAVE